MLSLGVVIYGHPLLCYAEIYKWVDENGVPHFSERKSETHKSEEISERLKKVGNFIEFAKTQNIEFYQPPKPYTGTEVVININLHEYQLSPASENKMNRHVTAIYETYSRWFGWVPNPTQPINIKIFGKYQGFEKYQQDRHYRYVMNRSHFSRRYNEVVMLGTEFSEATLGILFHESSHAIMHMEAKHMPKWINEGLAEVFSFVGFVGDEVRVGYNKEWVEIIKHKLREGSLQNFSNYLNISNNAWIREPANVERSFYTVAWSMMRFLVSSQGGIDALRKVIKVCKQLACSTGGRLNGMFERVYPGGNNALDAEWREWITALGSN